MDFIKQSRVARISLANGDTEELLVTPIGTNLYQLEESSLFGEVQYHDVIVTETQDNGVLQLLQIAKSSGLKTASWILPETAFESPTLKALLDRVMAVGGNWERAFGGMLTLHLPPLEVPSIVNEVKVFVQVLSGQATPPAEKS